MSVQSEEQRSTCLSLQHLGSLGRDRRGMRPVFWLLSQDNPAWTCSSVPFQDLESCRLRLDPELDRHRYERKISFAGVLDENEDSKDSLHSSSHTLKSDAGAEEKKGREAQGLLHVSAFLTGNIWPEV